MKGDEDVVKYLNKALRAELMAADRYWLHSKLLEDWGFARLAAKQLAESAEERQHADRLLDRVIFLGGAFLEGAPELQRNVSSKIGRGVKEILKIDLDEECAARALYMKARACCNEKSDYGSMRIFEDLIVDEEGHIDWLETQLDLIKTIGLENYCQIQAVGADSDE
ncbi:MAG: bacterioferritin [Hyphomicrobiales bacterium]